MHDMEGFSSSTDARQIQVLLPAFPKMARERAREGDKQQQEGQKVKRSESIHLAE